MTHPAFLLGAAALALLTGCESAPDPAADAYFSESDITAADLDLPAPPVSEAVADPPLDARAGSAAQPTLPPCRTPAWAGTCGARPTGARPPTPRVDAAGAPCRRSSVRRPRDRGGRRTARLRPVRDHVDAARAVRRFDATLDALAALGEVEPHAVTVDDVTSQVVDVEARLRAKRAAEARYVTFVDEVPDHPRGAGGPAPARRRPRRDRGDGGPRPVAPERRVAEHDRATVVGPRVGTPVPVEAWARAAEAMAHGWRGVLAVVFGVLPLGLGSRCSGWPSAAASG